MDGEKKMENPIKMDDFWGYHYFRKHPYIPPGKDRWLATPISHWIKSQPLTNRQFWGGGDRHLLFRWFLSCTETPARQMISFRISNHFRYLKFLVTFWFLQSGPPTLCYIPWNYPPTSTSDLFHFHFQQGIPIDLIYTLPSNNEQAGLAGYKLSNDELLLSVIIELVVF